MDESILAIEDTSNALINNFFKHEEIKTNDKVLTTTNVSVLGLDANAKEVLNYIHSLPPAYESDLDVVRQERKNPYPHTDVNDLTKSDISIPCNNRELIARVYRPINTENVVLPALIYFHGGGFVLGNIKSFDKMLSLMA